MPLWQEPVLPAAPPDHYGAFGIPDGAPLRPEWHIDPCVLVSSHPNPRFCAECGLGLQPNAAPLIDEQDVYLEDLPRGVRRWHPQCAARWRARKKACHLIRRLDAKVQFGCTNSDVEDEEDEEGEEGEGA